METEEIVKVQVQFTLTEGAISFTDCLYFTQEEYVNISPDTLEDMKRERFENWKKAVQNPLPAPTPEIVLQGIEEQIEMLQRQKEMIEAENN